MTEVFLMKLPSDECHWILLMISQQWCRWWLGAIRQQTITLANVDQIYVAIWYGHLIKVSKSCFTSLATALHCLKLSLRLNTLRMTWNVARRLPTSASRKKTGHHQGQVLVHHIHQQGTSHRGIHAQMIILVPYHFNGHLETPMKIVCYIRQNLVASDLPLN